MQFVNIILAVVVVAAGSGLAAPLGYDFSNSKSEPRRLDDITVGPISNTIELFSSFYSPSPSSAC